MFRFAIAAVAVAVAVAVAALVPGPAQAQRVKAGLLSCNVSGGLGLIVTSRKTLNCNFTPDNGGPPEHYVGSITKYGLDIGATTGGHMVWGVFAETRGGRAALAGDYVGASGEASIAAGLGANVLVGGSNRTVALQPVSVQGQVGLNLAIGVANLRLRPGR